MQEFFAKQQIQFLLLKKRFVDAVQAIQYVVAAVFAKSSALSHHLIQAVQDGHADKIDLLATTVVVVVAIHGVGSFGSVGLATLEDRISELKELYCCDLELFSVVHSRLTLGHTCVRQTEIVQHDGSMEPPADARFNANRANKRMKRMFERVYIKVELPVIVER